MRGAWGHGHGEVGFEDGARVRSGRGHGQVYGEEIRCGEWPGVIVAGPLVMRRRMGTARTGKRGAFSPSSEFRALV
jgi:hypothetical protein